MRSGRLGMLSTPAEGRSPADYPVWAADNGCFGKGYPGDEGYLLWLEKHAAHADRCVFATAPDVVGDAVATLKRSRPLLGEIRKRGYPAALVAQNGLERLVVPWGAFDALFIGGSPECVPCGYVRPIGERDRKLCPFCEAKLTEWKLSEPAAELAREAKRRGKYVHMGRVNSGKRFRYAESIGCDSGDGTFLAIAPKNLERMERW